MLRRAISEAAASGAQLCYGDKIEIEVAEMLRAIVAQC